MGLLVQQREFWDAEEKYAGNTRILTTPWLRRILHPWAGCICGYIKAALAVKQGPIRSSVFL